MKDQYECHGDGVKATGTQWIDQKLRAMEQLVDKFGPYCQHIQHTISEIKNSKDRAKVLFCSGFFIDNLSTAKAFSLTAQKSDIDIIGIVENVESIKRGYEKLLKTLPTPMQYLLIYQYSVPSSQKLREMRIQNQSIKIRNLSIIHKKSCIWKTMVLELIESILPCYVKRYTDVHSERNDEGSVSDGDNILFHVSCDFNSAVWPSLTNDSDELSLQLNAIHEICEKYK